MKICAFDPLDHDGDPINPTNTMFRAEAETGEAIIMSAWEPTPQELDALMLGGCVMLICVCEIEDHPPVAVRVHGKDGHRVDDEAKAQ
jgi:hypothetical protein